MVSHLRLSVHAGTAMVTCYEFLKRTCALPPEDDDLIEKADNLALS